MHEDLITHVGLDVHARTIAVATADAQGDREVRSWGVIAHTPADVDRLIARLSKPGVKLCFWYEAGPCGDLSAGREDLFTGREDLFTGREDLFTGREDPFAGGEDPFTGREDPFTGREYPFAGGEDPFTGREYPFARGGYPFTGREYPFARGEYPFTGGEEGLAGRCLAVV